MIHVIGHAIHDYYHRLSPSKLLIHNNYGKPEIMPIEVYFRDEEDMPELELQALDLCHGRVLDIGAGAGSHALYLQQKNIDVTALEISSLAAAVMKHRGVKNIVNKDIFAFGDQQYDTLLMLMNGIGLTGTISGLRKFLQHAKSLLLPGGQLVFDSSDVAYLYKRNIPKMEKYYGEIDFRYEYKKQKTPWFTWLYIDKKMLSIVAEEEGWTTQVLFEDEHDQYLAKLLVKDDGSAHTGEKSLIKDLPMNEMRRNDDQSELI